MLPTVALSGRDLGVEEDRETHVLVLLMVYALHGQWNKE